MSTHIPRYADVRLSQLLAILPAIMIDGAKGVGKTQTAEQFAKTVIELDKAGEREALAADYERLSTGTPPILLDEWQHLPEVWDRVRRLVDDKISIGSIILTGSLQSRNPAIHTGAGRIVRFQMRPLSLAERMEFSPCVTLSDALSGNVPERLEAVSSLGLKDYIAHIVSSGFPAIYQETAEAREELLDTYLENIVSREFSSQGIRVHQPAVLSRWMRSFAAAAGTTSSYDKILAGATAGEGDKPAKETTIAYREALERLWLLDELPYWSEGEDFFSRLKQTPKHYLADPALEAHLLGLSAQDLLSGKPRTAYDHDYQSITGRLFESLVVMSLRTYASSMRARCGYVRTRNGDHEVDFVAQKNQAIVAIEIKMAAAITDADVKHLNWFEERVGDRVKEKIILYTGERAYRRPADRVLVIPAALFG